MIYTTPLQRHVIFMPSKSTSKVAFLESLQTILYRTKSKSHSASKFVENHPMQSVVVPATMDIGLPLSDMITMCSSINQAMMGSDKCMLLTEPPTTVDARYTEAVVMADTAKTMGIVSSLKPLRGVDFSDKDVCKKVLGSYSSDAKDLLYPAGYQAKSPTNTHNREVPILRVFYNRDILTGECVTLHNSSNIPTTIILTPHERVLCVDLSKIIRPVVMRKSQQNNSFEFLV